MQEHSFSITISGYIKKRELAALEKFEKESEKAQKDITSQSDLMLHTSVINSKRQQIETKFTPANWLDDAAHRAKEIKLVTHALKYTHVEARGSNIYATDLVKDQKYLTTASLSALKVDAVGNAASLDVAKLLQLEHNDESLIDALSKGDYSALREFASGEEQLEAWVNGLLQVLGDNELSSHSLAKQVLFPVSATEYHLLAPLFPTSLADALYQKINDSRFSETAKIARDAKKNKQHVDLIVTDYPGVAIQSFGGTKPQNVSQLNASRGGKSYLMNSVPPVWKDILKPPTADSIFKDKFNERAWKKARELRDYLFERRNKGSIKEYRDCRAEFVDNLIDMLFVYAAELRNLPSGWGEKSKLPLSQQLWLDSRYNKDSSEREIYDLEHNWKKEIADQFAAWLNKRITRKDSVMGQVEHSEWSDIVLKKLKLLKEDLEVMYS